MKRNFFFGTITCKVLRVQSIVTGGHVGFFKSLAEIRINGIVVLF
jgi:hypothetical protein